MSNYALITLGAFLVLCASFDVLFRRIPNRLTYPAMLMAVLYHCIVGGTAGLVLTLGGLGVGTAMLMPFYLLKGMGAGDVKLMGVVGACLGPKEVFHAFLWTGLTGGLYALILLAFHPHQLVIFLKNCLYKCLYVAKFFLYGMNAARIPLISKEEGAQEAEPVMVCYGVAIALGTIGYLLWKHAGYSSWTEFISALSSRLF